MKYLNFIERNFGIDFLKKLILVRGENSRIFSFCFYEDADKCLNTILNYLFEKFKTKNNFLEHVLLSVDDRGNSFLIHYFMQNDVSGMIKIARELFELIKANMGLEFLKQLLLLQNNRWRNFHQALLSNEDGGVEKCLEVLEILLEVVGKDKEFFILLTKQFKIPNEINVFLKNNFEIESTLEWGVLVQEFVGFVFAYFNILFIFILLFLVMEICVDFGRV